MDLMVGRIEDERGGYVIVTETRGGGHYDVDDASLDGSDGG